MATPSRLPSVRRPGGNARRSRTMSMIEPGDFSITAPAPALAPAPASTITSVPSAPSAVAEPSTKSAKRRSLLPQFNRKVSGEERQNAGIQEESGDDSTGEGRDAARSAALKALETPNYEDVRREADRRAMPPPASKLSRSTSIRQPAGQPGRPDSISGYKAAPSRSNHGEKAAPSPLTMLTRLASGEGGVKRTASTRLPQSGRQAAVQRWGSVQSSGLHGRSDSTSTTASGTADKRASFVGRPPSSSVSTAGGRSVEDSPTPPKSPPKQAHPNRRSQMLPPAKPAFNTYQQHYSPAKSALPKPPLPSSRKARPESLIESDEPITFAVLKQQVELLQLSLLLQASTQTMNEYEGSAFHKLSRKHIRLRRDFAALKDAELTQRRLLNLEALETWSPDANLLAESLHTLSRSYEEVCALTEPDSRYHELIITFSNWLDRCVNGTAGPHVSDLDSSWHETHASIAMKLRLLQRSLQSLPPLPPQCGQSSLGMLLANCTGLADGMLRELDTMTLLEKEVLRRERQRVEERVRGLMRERDSSVTQAEWVPAWERAK